ncbi:MAG: putative lipid II flippase FtsW [Chloroflexi bacterium]|nr:MAG: putative lipid II flippase FtsW [Chloroflexota bacterium]HEY66656.1 putative lipid II flippase FtsW [Thermoflexia bacterium]
MPESKLRRAHPDYILMLAVAGLVIIGLMMVYSATFDWSYQKYGSSFRIASRQFLWVGLGLIALMVMAGIPYDWWQRVAVPVMGVALLLLVLVLFVGDERFGARRSFFGGSVQPGELAKLATAIYVAAWLASKGDQIRDVTYGLVPFAILIGMVAGLIVMQPDISTAVLIVLTALAMFFFAGADIFQLAIGGIVSGITFLVLINQLPYARQRIDEYLQIWRDPTRVGYHIQQALIALGSGGLFGVGLGQGQEKLGYLPAAHTDSIFAVLGEELGFVGCLVVVGLFVLLAYRGFKIALEASEPFAALLACGITCWLTFQALINVAVMTGLLPFTGIALPFISSGGSAMVVSLAGVGLLLSVSRGRRVGKQVRKGERRRAHLDRRWGNRGTRLSRSGRRAGAGR